MRSQDVSAIQDVLSMRDALTKAEAERDLYRSRCVELTMQLDKALDAVIAATNVIKGQA